MKPAKAQPCNFTTGYMDAALLNLAEVVEVAQADLRNRNFDTIVGTGLSGAIVIPALALAMGKSFVIVRKRNDDSHHGGDLVGKLGRRWIFLDDFVSTGETRKRVIDKVDDACKNTWHDVHRRASLVGQYTYENRLWMTGAEVRTHQRRLAEWRNG